LICLGVAWCFPLRGSRFLGAVERLGIRLAKHKHPAIISIAAAEILLRLSLLGWLPIPVPQIHDEFAHLLAADTFAHGHLTNPSHPMWVFLDTVHVNQFPTYMSKYPPGQGAALALGQLLGSPWFGVLFSVAVMCAAVLWALQGWLPASWALLGGVLVMLRLGFSSYWINSYWGGAVPAIGGALVVGALPRLVGFHGCGVNLQPAKSRARDAVLLALGVAILVNSRPVGGLVICLPAMAFLLVWLCGKDSPSWRATLPRLILPFCAVMLLCGMFIGYYNWRLTGSPLLFPEMLNERTYSRSPDFIWQRLEPPLHYRNEQFQYFYNGWARYYWSQNRVDSIGRAAKHTAMIVLKFVYFFLWPELSVPLLGLLSILRDRRVRPLVVQFGLCFVGWYSLVWFLPHYAAPATAITFALLVQAIRHLRRWQWRGRPVGIGLTRVVVLFALILAPFHQRGGTLPPVTSLPRTMGYRAKFASELNAMPGEHLAIVHYGPTSTDGGEWVYNSADIDHAKIVWARDIPGIDLHPLLNYFQGRHVWLVEHDTIPPRLTPYADDRPQ
jgi:hypothetical protein